MRIARVEARRYRVPLDPPLIAAWDPTPRVALEETVVIVHADDGSRGFASGAGLPDRDLLERLVTGLDPMRTEVIREICETVDFHGGRPWALEVAVWDLVGRALGQPLWKLLGGRSKRLVAYASCAERVDAEERMRRVAVLRDAGVRAVKIRLDPAGWRRDVEMIRRVRASAGPDLVILADANQGWRMPGDRRVPWDVATAAACARELEDLDAHWLEEPLPTADIEGYARLRRLTSIRIAAGEMVRAPHEARDLVVRGGVDVVQPDALLTGGLGGCRRISALAELCGAAFTPHSWTNGLGMLANLHLAIAVSTAGLFEVPLDPPSWTPERRDWLLPAPIEIAPDGTIAPPPGPGLGVTPNLDALERFRVA